MAFSQFLRNMFGSSGSDAEFDDLDHPEVDSASVSVHVPSADGNADATTVSDAELPTELIDAILAVINAQLPPVAAQCIDREAQRRYMASVLGSPLADLAESMRRKAVSELTGDRAKMQAELEELRAERKEVSGKREEQKAALLSEQRQRRALNDRNRDLEAKIDELDSQIEQHKLTIASLMNKLRVAEVTEGDSQALRDDIVRLQHTISERDETIEAKDREITELSEKIAAYESASALEAALEQRREASGGNAADPTDEAPAAPKKRRGRPRRQNTRAYDPENDASADLDSVDWLLPGGVPAGHTPHASDPDFGYQPPKHTPAPDSDAQLTLF